MAHDGTDLEDLGLTEDLVTGEAVVLDLRPASFATRALAMLADVVVLAGLALIVSLALIAVLPSADGAGQAAVLLVAMVGLFVGVPAGVETITRGRSPGKWVAGLRVVRDDGGPVRFRHALIRALLGVFEIYVATGSVAIIASLANRRGKRIGDMLAGTYVVRERTPGLSTAPPVMPPYLAGWAAGADLGRVPDRLALAVRQFLQRAPMLHPASRQRLGESLAGEAIRYVAPGPPPGTHPEAFLAAVLAERHRRDLLRLAGEAETRRRREEQRRSASPLSSISTALVGEEDD